jgi:hypothetical protein
MLARQVQLRLRRNTDRDQAQRSGPRHLFVSDP